jgi:hypothetical protein
VRRRSAQVAINRPDPLLREISTHSSLTLQMVKPPGSLLSSLTRISLSRQNVVTCQTRGSKAPTREYATPSSSSSSFTNPYPYPTHNNPTPHQIFHLPSSATENDVKARCMFPGVTVIDNYSSFCPTDFDLVRLYHPDKASTTVPPEVAHERFQAITTAYDILRGKKSYPGASGSSSSGVEDRSYHTTAAYRAARRRRQELYASGAVDDRWKDRMFLGLAVAVRRSTFFSCSLPPTDITSVLSLFYRLWVYSFYKYSRLGGTP